MTLPSSGPLSMSDINVELNRSPTATISLNDPQVRELSQIVSGPVGFNNLLGKAAWTPTLFPANQSVVGTVANRNFTVTCIGAPSGATIFWEFLETIGGWSILSGQGTDSVNVRTTGSLDLDRYSVLRCTVTFGGISKSASTILEYSTFGIDP